MEPINETTQTILLRFLLEAHKYKELGGGFYQSPKGILYYSELLERKSDDE